MLRIAGSILSLFCHVQLYLFDIALQCCLPKDHLKKKLREWSKMKNITEYNIIDNTDDYPFHYTTPA